MGDAGRLSIEEVWHGTAARSMRRLQAGRRRLEASVCAERDCGIDEIDRDSDAEFARRLMEKLSDRTLRGTPNVSVDSAGLKQGGYRA